MTASAQERRDAAAAWLAVAVALGACVFLGRLITQVQPYYVLAGAGAVVLAGVTILSPKLGLTLVVFSMVLSPKVEGAHIASGMAAGSAGTSLMFKVEDFLLPVILLAWLARTAILKRGSFLIKTPLNLPIFAMGSIFFLSTAIGIMRGNFGNNALRPLVYVLKYVEYYLLFFMTVNVVESREDVRKYVRYGWVTALIVTVFGYSQIGNGLRVSGPFDAAVNASNRGEVVNEANTFGGYFIVIFGLLFGYFTQTLGWSSLAAALSLLYMMTPFLLTLSRSSYGALAVAVMFHILATPKRRVAMLFCLGTAAFIVALTPMLRNPLTKRVEYTFSGESGGKVAIGGAHVALEGSAYARVQSWEHILTVRFPARPILGWGVTGVGLVDAYYPRLLGETGLVGLACFFWLMWRIWAVCWNLFLIGTHPEDRALALGVMTGLAGLMLHSVAANTFIIVRIMEPFWFATALVARVYADEASSRKDEAA